MSGVFSGGGGYGVSAEHTLYQNLSSGIPAPRSGQAAQNGMVVAEQIGGQIFIDTWGLICPGDWRRAAAYAQKAASVGWDRNGVYGGMFVAACVSAAFTQPTAQDILEKGLSVIPEDCAYARMARDVRRFHQVHPQDWRACLAYIQRQYGSDRYPGWCHIIPNGAILVLALLYGEGDFTRTLNIGNMCGFDTDCNVGNLGAILGVLNGLDGIDLKKWRDEINDFLACSSVVGSLNITDAASSAVYLVKLAHLAAGQPLPAPLAALAGPGHRLHFELPGSTQAVRVQLLPAGLPGAAQVSVQNTAEAAASGHRSLKVCIAPFSNQHAAKIFVKTYYEKEDFTDGRYTPSFSPLLYPGQALTAQVMPGPGWGAVRAGLFVTDRHTGRLHHGPSVPLQEGTWQPLRYELPAGEDWCISEAGVYVQRDPARALDKKDPGRLALYLDDLAWGGAPDYRVDFAKEHNWCWEVRPTYTDLSQFTRFKGLWLLEDGLLHGHCSTDGECYTGDVCWQDYRCEALLAPQHGGWHGLNARVQGAARSYALCLAPGQRIALVKKEGLAYRELASAPLAWQPGGGYALALEVRGARLAGWCGGRLVVQATDADRPYLNGAIGFSVRDGGHCRYSALRVTPITKESEP